LKRIVEEMGGKLDFDSEVGRGTSFRIALPVPAPAPAAG
jgi:signal transduction histidine kinase